MLRRQAGKAGREARGVFSKSKADVKLWGCRDYCAWLPLATTKNLQDKEVECLGLDLQFSYLANTFHLKLKSLYNVEKSVSDDQIVIKKYFSKFIRDVDQRFFFLLWKTPSIKKNAKALIF